jgi:hypothetical protein
MGTSRSTDRAAKYIGGASIFSGRPDPTWAINADDAERLKSLWDSMKSYGGALPTAPVLGYRGCFLRDSSEREWFAYGGCVTLKTAPGSESRKDNSRKFEALLLSSAPDGAVPPQIVDPKNLS